MDAPAKPGFRGMKGLKKQRRIQVIIGSFAALISAFAVIYFFVPSTAFNLFRSPTEVYQNAPSPGEIFRIGGLVEAGSLTRGQGETVTFRVTDTNASVPVSYTGILPDLFAEGQGMVGTGQMQGDTFVATEILAKHDETYMPKEVIDSLKEQGVYQEPSKD